MRHNKRTVLAGVLALVLLLSACGNADAGVGADTEETAGRKITAEEGKGLMDAGGVVVVDVRRADEYEAGHVPGAINVPNESIEDVQPETLPDLEAALIVYCRTGVRSADAAGKLTAMGYTSVADMGGFVDWPYDTVAGGEPGVYGEAKPADPAEEPAMAEDPSMTEETPKDQTPAEKQPGAAEQPQAAEEPGILTTFTATDLEGNTVDEALLADYDLTMVNVWATFCGPCLREMPDLGELAAEYKDKGVQIVGLVSDTLASDGTISQDQVDLAKDIVDQTGADYPHILPSEDLFGILSQIQFVPTTFFVDSTGHQVGSAVVQSMGKSEWEKVLDEMLEEVAQ